MNNMDLDESILSTSQSLDYQDEDSNIAADEPNDDDDEYEPEEETIKKRKLKQIEPVPERRSKRIATQPSVRSKLEQYGLVKGERLWKEFEKRLFLNACKEHGTKEVDKIIEDVPTKAPDVVKNRIQREKRNQNYTIETQFIDDSGDATVLDDGETSNRRGLHLTKERRATRIDLPDATPQGQIVEIMKRRQRNAPIEMWIDVFEKKVSDEETKLKQDGSTAFGDYSSIVPHLLQWIGDHEKHPPPEQCGGVDYAAIYKYLGCLCQGEAPPDLNTQSSIRLRRLFSTLCKTINQLGLEKETEYLENYRGVHSKYPNSVSWDSTTKSAVNIAEMSQVPGMNPLQLHPEMFSLKEIPKLDDIIKLTSEEIVEDGLNVREEIIMNLKPPKRK